MRQIYDTSTDQSGNATSRGASSVRGDDTSGGRVGGPAPGGVCAGRLRQADEAQGGDHGTQTHSSGREVRGGCGARGGDEHADFVGDLGTSVAG